jgi:hypothetical protein
MIKEARSGRTAEFALSIRDWLSGGVDFTAGFDTSPYFHRRLSFLRRSNYGWRESARKPHIRVRPCHKPGLSWCVNITTGFDVGSYLHGILLSREVAL